MYRLAKTLRNAHEPAVVCDNFSKNRCKEKKIAIPKILNLWTSTNFGFTQTRTSRVYISLLCQEFVWTFNVPLVSCSAIVLHGFQRHC